MWSAVVCIHGQLTWQGLICADLQDMDLDMYGRNIAETMHDKEGEKLAVGW